MRARHPWWLPLAAVCGAALVRVISATWRFTVSDAPEYTAALARGERFVYAFWHSALLPLAVLHRNEGAAVLVSRHRDGELMTRVLEHLGYVAARGSSTRGGEAGVLEMLALAGEGRALAITPDGPRGPACRVKPGLVYLAARTGLPVVPVTAAADRAWVFRSWDRFRIPQPFARVRIDYGEPIVVRLDDAPEEAWRERIQAALEDLTRRTTAAAGEPA